MAKRYEKFSSKSGENSSISGSSGSSLDCAEKVTMNKDFIYHDAARLVKCGKFLDDFYQHGRKQGVDALDYSGRDIQLIAFLLIKLTFQILFLPNALFLRRRIAFLARHPALKLALVIMMIKWFGWWNTREAAFATSTLAHFLIHAVFWGASLLKQFMHFHTISISPHWANLLLQIYKVGRTLKKYSVPVNDLAFIGTKVSTDGKNILVLFDPMTHTLEG